MISLEVKDVTCACVFDASTRAMNAAGARAGKWRFDLANQQLQIDGTEADAAELNDAVRDVGHASVRHPEHDRP